MDTFGDTPDTRDAPSPLRLGRGVQLVTLSLDPVAICLGDNADV